jgi:anti-sigma regulatory factor (Ser/Thr protein kinase)
VVEIVFKSELSELGRLAEAVADFGRRHALPERAMQHMGLALDELVTNVIVHGYGAASGTVVVRLALSGEWLEAEVVDQAPAFDPFTAPPPDLESPLEERSVGGLGVHFVRTLLDRVAYTRDGSLNRVQLSKRIARQDPTP